jgi:hypothetical protein
MNTRNRECLRKVAQTLLNFNEKENSKEVEQVVSYLCDKFNFQVIGDKPKQLQWNATTPR